MSRLVLLSGWGIDARIWQPLTPHWPQDIRVSAPDWPGYGSQEALEGPGDLAALAEAMAPELPSDAVWVGWSLGAPLVAQLAARLPAPKGLVMIGMGSSFCRSGGVTPRELQGFQAAFARRPHATWRHFLRWQSSGEPDPRESQRRLKELLGDRPAADHATLAWGLDALASLNVPNYLPCPRWRIAGGDDPLMSPADRQAANIVVPRAGHCPQLSQPEYLASRLAALAREVGS